MHCRVIADNKCEFQHSSSHGGCNVDARLVSKTRQQPQTNISEIRQNDFLSRLQFPHTNKTRSHLAECESFKNRHSCQPILDKPIQCVNSVKGVSFNPSRASRRPTALVYEHSQVVRYVRMHQIRHRAVGSQYLFGYSLHITCFSSSLFPSFPLWSIHSEKCSTLPPFLWFHSAFRRIENSIQDGMKFYFVCQRFHPTMCWKVFTK